MARMPIHLTTERLLIRPLVPADIDAMDAVFSDPEVMRYVPGGACDRERSLARLQSLIERQYRHGYSKWAVAEKASGHLIGGGGLQYLDGGGTRVPRVGPRRTSRACGSDRRPRQPAIGSRP
jgi:RimJ/RimL family protein N-acetyltransferase